MSRRNCTSPKFKNIAIVVPWLYAWMLTLFTMFQKDATCVLLCVLVTPQRVTLTFQNLNYLTAQGNECILMVFFLGGVIYFEIVLEKLQNKILQVRILR